MPRSRAFPYNARVSERLEKLQKMLEREPNDPFLLYGIAMEHKKLNDAAAALEFFDRVTRLDPGYCYAYHQKGLVHESQGDTDAAKRGQAMARMLIDSRRR